VLIQKLPALVLLPGQHATCALREVTCTRTNARAERDAVHTCMGPVLGAIEHGQHRGLERCIDP
jgi:hypothetical protein